MGAREFDVACIVKRLVGPLDPIGDSWVDEKRYENLLHMIDVVNDLVDEIKSISEYAKSHEYSVQKIGKQAKSFLYDLTTSGD